MHDVYATFSYAVEVVKLIYIVAISHRVPGSNPTPNSRDGPVKMHAWCMCPSLNTSDDSQCGPQSGLESPVIHTSKKTISGC